MRAVLRAFIAALERGDDLLQVGGDLLVHLGQAGVPGGFGCGDELQRGLVLGAGEGQELGGGDEHRRDTKHPTMRLIRTVAAPAKAGSTRDQSPEPHRCFGKMTANAVLCILRAGGDCAIAAPASIQTFSREMSPLRNSKTCRTRMLMRRPFPGMPMELAHHLRRPDLVVHDEVLAVKTVLDVGTLALDVAEQVPVALADRPALD